MNWDAEAIERLRGLWNDGYSCSQIAMRLGTSKNSVIGKSHRLKLPRRIAARYVTPKGNPAVMRMDTPERLQADAARRKPHRKPRAKVVATVRPLPINIPAPVTDGVSIVDVTGCRFPIGEGDVPGRHLFCNCVQREKSAFCEYHAAVAFTPATKERKLTWLKVAA